MTSSEWTVTQTPRENIDLPDLAPGDPDATVTGRLLGEATSYRAGHNHPESRLPGRDDRRCSACRWFEVMILRVQDEPAEWLVYTAGRSARAGETTRARVTRTTSAFDVVELMVVRNDEGTFMPKPNARALAQAAGHDELLQDAYVNRVTV